MMLEALLQSAILMAGIRFCWEPLGLFLLLFLGISEAIRQKPTVQKLDQVFLSSEKTLTLKCPLIGSDIPGHRKNQYLSQSKVSQRITFDIIMDFHISCSWQKTDHQVWYNGRSSDGYKVGKCTRFPEDATPQKQEPKLLLSAQQYISVSVTCIIQGSYPSATKQVWLKNCKETDPGKANPMPWNLSIDWVHTIQNALEGPTQKDLFTCQGVHPTQPPFNASLVFEYKMKPKEIVDPGSLQKGHQLLPYNWVLWLGLLLNKATATIVLLCLFLRQPGQPSSGPIAVNA